MKCQNPFSRKNKKNISIYRPLKILPRVLSINDHETLYLVTRKVWLSLGWIATNRIICLINLKRGNLNVNINFYFVTCFPIKCGLTVHLNFSKKMIAPKSNHLNLNLNWLQ